MSAEAIAIKPTCRNCGAKLELDEIHYYDHGNEVTCKKCEVEWLEAMHQWRAGFGGKEPPAQP